MGVLCRAGASCRPTVLMTPRQGQEEPSWETQRWAMNEAYRPKVDLVEEK